jgi:hypothetical protein
MVLDRKQMRRLAAELPEASVRSAVLERRKLAQYYPVWLESIPFLILAAVVVASFWAAPIAFVSGTSALRVWAIPLVLALMIGGGWILSRRLAVSGCRVPQKTRAFLPSAENPIRLGEAVTALELRCFMAAKIGFAFLLALMQTEKLAEFAGSEVPPAVGLLQWLLPGALLGLFAGYIIKLSKLSRFKSQGGKGP